MIKCVNIVIYSAVNKSKIKEYKNLSVETANLLLPSDGFLCLSGNNQMNHYKVVQIIKEINESIYTSKGTSLTVYIFVQKVTDSDYYLLK